MNTAPVFVKIDEYKDVIDVLHLIRTKIAEAKKTLAQINELKNREDNELSARRPMKAKKEMFFMHIPEPLIVQRAVLESSRETIRFMQQYEQIKSMRIVKTKKIMELKRQLKDISRMVQELKARMPEVTVSKPHHQHAQPRQPEAAHQQHQRESRPKKDVPRKLSELERLEAELSEVERKLGKLR